MKKQKEQRNDYSVNSSDLVDIIVIGGGMVGLSVANQIIEKGITKNIFVLEKESKIGLHTSGRNSGVIHAGLYYKPKSIKARVCVEGGLRLRDWIEERNLPINKCGKVIVPQKEYLDSQLDLLAERGRSNGATVEIWDRDQLNSFLPEARSATGRALWSPNTSVVKPLAVLNQLAADLVDKGVRIIKEQKNWLVVPEKRQIILSDGSELFYGHLINCAGLQADRLAHKFEVGFEYKLLPFKGIYWQLKKQCPIQPRCNLYPVPDLNVPFLGVHFTPSADSVSTVSIGPTATPAFGRENYSGFKGLEPAMALNNIALLAREYFADRGGFRKYVKDQAFLSIPQIMLKNAQELIPGISLNHIERSKKIGIRSQLFNFSSRKLEDDFVCLNGPSSTHVLNAISPAFTASFALADLILEQAFGKDKG